MSMSPDPEVGREQDEQVDDHQIDGREDHVTTSNQPSRGGSNFGDSSEPLFSIYSKAADDEDNKMVERWQKDADGILIFTGLFSAAVAALLAVTVQDLRPNSQDTSAFYLGNIYQVLADPNVTRSSTLPPVAKPPSFSPSRSAVWVNSLWFLSLVMSLSCALWVTSLHQWARRYLRRSQPSRCNPERRARMRAFFAEGVDNMHIPWAVEGLPTLLHLSLFLFFGGLSIFLFDIDREVFSYVVWWIGLFCLVYGMITVLPLIRQDSPYNSPLSTPAWFLRVAMPYVTVKILTIVMYSFCVCFYICFGFCFSFSRFDDPIRDIISRILDSVNDLGKYYCRRMLGGVEMAIEEAVSERLSKIDGRILDWTITTLGDDDSLKNFFEAIPGFFNSKLVQHLEGGFPRELRKKYRNALIGFLVRTWSSNSVSDSEKLRRVDISMNAMSWISDPSSTLYDILFERWDEVPRTLEMGQYLARWCTSDGRSTAYYAQSIVARILFSLRERDDGWIALAARAFGLTEQDLRENIVLGDDSVLLAILIYVTRQCRSRSFYLFDGLEELLSKFDIRNTLPGLQHDFCALWNEIVQEARMEGPNITPFFILREIRQSYIALHQCTDAAPTAFSASTDKYNNIMFEPSSYPLCDLASHRPDSIAQIPVQVPLPTQPTSPTDGGNTPPGQAEQVKDVVEPRSSSNPTTAGIGATSHGPDVTPPTSPVHSSSRPTDTSPTAVVAPAPQDITSTDTQSHPPKGSEQQDSDIVVPSAEPGTSQILSTASTPAPAPRPAPIPTSLPKSFDAGVTSVSNPSHISPPPISSSIPASGSIGSATLPRLRARGLANARNMCFANAVLQLLVNLPPSRSLFTELCDLKGMRRAGVFETGGGATPLVDATVRFFKEFMVEEESPSMQQQSPPATGRISRADGEKEDGDIVDSFEPTYMYDAMKEKRQLKSLLDGQQQDAEEFLCLYLDALDEELPALLASISGRESASAAPKVEEHEVSQSGLTRVYKELDNVPQCPGRKNLGYICT